MPPIVESQGSSPGSEALAASGVDTHAADPLATARRCTGEGRERRNFSGFLARDPQHLEPQLVVGPGQGCV